MHLFLRYPSPAQLIKWFKVWHSYQEQSLNILCSTEPHSFLPMGQGVKEQLLAFLDHSLGEAEPADIQAVAHTGTYMRSWGSLKQIPWLQLNLQKPETSKDIWSYTQVNPVTNTHHTMSSGVMWGTGVHGFYSSSSRPELLQALSEIDALENSHNRLHVSASSSQLVWDW